MNSFKIMVKNKQGQVLAEKMDSEEIMLYYIPMYQDGDTICIEALHYPVSVWMQLDDVLGKSLVYLTGAVEYHIPFGEKRANLSPRAFSGEQHLITVREMQNYERTQYRNLALNVCDQHHIQNLYPHIEANVETRGESVFAAQNAIDGVKTAGGHGEWPYESWGINCQDDAMFTLHFGRTVCVNKLVFYLRSDFPHDNWWSEAIITFSDGSVFKPTFVKTGKAQAFDFSMKEVEWLRMSDMKKAETESPFPALLQLEVYGEEK